VLTIERTCVHVPNKEGTSVSKQKEKSETGPKDPVAEEVIEKPKSKKEKKTAKKSADKRKKKSKK